MNALKTSKFSTSRREEELTPELIRQRAAAIRQEWSDDVRNHRRALAGAYQRRLAANCDSRAA